VTMASVLEFRPRCLCAGSGCGGHLMLGGVSSTTITPAGWQGAAQHTWIRSCDGLHAPGPCPEPQVSHTVLSLPGVS
jgi:hypothetical protein